MEPKKELLERLTAIKQKVKQIYPELAEDVQETPSETTDEQEFYKDKDLKEYHELLIKIEKDQSH